MNRFITCIMFLLGFTACKKSNVKDTGPATIITPPVTGIIDTSRTSWWQKAKFGMFIHWGVYSVPAGIYNGVDISDPASGHYGSGEWIMHNLRIPVASYKEFAKQFNPTAYNPEEWVQLAKDAGMKYIVFTAKHHDGFAMYDTKYSDWNVVKATPYGKDILRPLVEACRKYGLKIGIYYSQANDWINKGAAHDGFWDPAQAGSMDDYIDKTAIPQVRELLSNYGDVLEIWWDIPDEMTAGRAAKFSPVLALQPKTLTNNRLNENWTGGDFDTPEQSITASSNGRPWESCMTMNDSWGYTKNDKNFKSSSTIIRNLIKVASLGGNYLLNVGPDATGKIPQPEISILKDLAGWMRLNSESIYDTYASPFKFTPWGNATTKLTADGNTSIYLHIFNWPGGEKLHVPGVKNKLLSALVLANGKTVNGDNDDTGITLDIPVGPVDNISSVVKIVVKGKLQVDAYEQGPEANGSFVLLASAADLHNPNGGDDIHVENEGNPNLGYWTNPWAYASWKIIVKTPGIYKVQAEIATEAGASVIVASVNGNSAEKTLTTTGGYGSYKLITLGNLKIANSGSVTFTLAPDPGNWQPVNVRKIILTP